ncbi:hypothetical protein [Kibdelosporangium phytohabitans]|uniref:Uncharacterized protein n=1 Tax=Kibdelosporangium phytohabitans TaxID=860235 RepID=A0A0N9I7E8_9PSEU|nr:hypothetical protein [Kibdelosporangium phytohabitans]ALG10830.1 hypothetical protein AOZ06_31620 [Kibdelosporangium phytohabitans]MBE1462004.1 hypothetical protein [Kibdelosporangium phytohabitans]
MERRRGHLEPDQQHHLHGGFGVRNGSGARFVLSAGHCGRPGHRIADRAGEFAGTVGSARDDHDI